MKEFFSVKPSYDAVDDQPTVPFEESNHNPFVVAPLKLVAGALLPVCSEAVSPERSTMANPSVTSTGPQVSMDPRTVGATLIDELPVAEEMSQPKPRQEMEAIKPNLPQTTTLDKTQRYQFWVIFWRQINSTRPTLFRVAVTLIMIFILWYIAGIQIAVVTAFLCIASFQYIIPKIKRPRACLEEPIFIEWFSIAVRVEVGFGAFFRRSSLHDDTLAKVWQLSARGGKHLNQEQFNRALHLIYLAQQKLPITIETEKELLAQNRQMVPFIQYQA